MHSMIPESVEVGGMHIKEFLKTQRCRYTYDPANAMITRRAGYHYIGSGLKPAMGKLQSEPGGKMNVKEYLEKVAYVDDMKIGDDVSKVYKSKFDDSYMTHVGMEGDVKYLADREITDKLTHGVGFSPKDGKWYGWSHRAIYGFREGSTCKKGDCHYVPLNESDAIEAAIRFESEDAHLNVRAGKPQRVNGQVGVEVMWDYSENVPNEKLRGEVGSTFHYFPEKYGRGEWVAETMEDAKQMAIDFNEGVS